MKQAFHLLETLKHGGAENVACNYAKILCKLGISSTFVALDCSEEYKKMILSQGIYLENRINRKMLVSADYLFINSNKNLLRLLPYIILLKRQKTRVIYIQHLFYSESKFSLISILINLLCTDFVRITPITEKFVAKYIKIPTSFIVNFYLNKYRNNRYADIRRNVREELGISQIQTIIMFSAVFKVGKGLRDCLQLAEKLKNSCNVTFLIVGDGPEAWLLDEYEGKNVIRTGLVNDVERYLIASDIYFFPSKREMLPMALVEAINTDKAILAIKNQVTDFLLEKNTYSTIEDACDKILKKTCPANFIHYDELYAIRALQQLLQKNEE